MKRILLALALSASLPACTGHPVSAGEIVDHAKTDIDRVEAGYRSVKAIVDLLEPYLPADRVAQIHATEAKIVSAIALARQAATVAEQLRALKTAMDATAELAAAPAGAK